MLLAHGLKLLFIIVYCPDNRHKVRDLYRDTSKRGTLDAPPTGVEIANPRYGRKLIAS